MAWRPRWRRAPPGRVRVGPAGHLRGVSQSQGERRTRPPLPLKTTSEISVLQWISALLAAASWQVAEIAPPSAPYVCQRGRTLVASANPAPGAATSPRLYNDLPEGGHDQETIGSPTLDRSQIRIRRGTAIPLWFKSKFRPGGSTTSKAFKQFQHLHALTIALPGCCRKRQLRRQTIFRSALVLRQAAWRRDDAAQYRRVGAGARVNMDDAGGWSCTSVGGHLERSKMCRRQTTISPTSFRMSVFILSKRLGAKIHTIYILKCCRASSRSSRLVHSRRGV